MAKFNLYLRDKNKDGETPIVLFVSYNGLRFKYPTSSIIHPKYWNDTEMTARKMKNFTQAKALNNHLKYIIKTAEDTLYKLEVELRRFPSKNEYVAELDSALNTKKGDETKESVSLDFLAWYQQFIDDSRSGARLNAGKRFDLRSIQKYEATLNYLIEFNKKFHLTFENINSDFHSKFSDFFNKKGFKLNTVGKHIQVLKTFLNYATEIGVNKNFYYKSRSFKTYHEEAFSIYLNVDQLNELYTYDLSKTLHLERQRDLFIVGCWTGLRFSDLQNLSSNNISGDFMTVRTQKTDETVVIPLHSVVKEVYNKYKDIYDNGFPPAISNQKMNEYLKQICRKVKGMKDKVIQTEFTSGGIRQYQKKLLPDLITTHTARRSFATNAYLSGFPSISIMKITGHRTEKSFLKYIKITPEENAKKLLEHWNKLNSEAE
jgi:integrase